MNNNKLIENYQDKLNKYILKNNIIGGYPGCIRERTDKKLEQCFIKNLSNLTPHTGTFFRPFTRCSYSVWNENQSQLYIPTPPTDSDKIFSLLDYYVRFYQLDCSRLKQSDSGNKIDIVVWSPVYKKWYETTLFPYKFDFTFFNIAREFNAFNSISSDGYPLIVEDNKTMSQKFSPDMFAQLADIVTVQISQLLMLRGKIANPDEVIDSPIKKELITRLRTDTGDSILDEELKELEKELENQENKGESK
jgi:hypothetical protein